MSKPTREGEDVIFDEPTNMYIFTGKEDRITYEFDADKKGWFPRLTNEIIDKQQAMYAIDGVDETV